MDEPVNEPDDKLRDDHDGTIQHDPSNILLLDDTRACGRSSVKLSHDSLPSLKGAATGLVIDDELLTDDPRTSKNRCCCLRVKACCSRCYRCLKPVMWKYHRKPEPGSSRLQRFAYGLMCPPHGMLASTILTIAAILAGFGLIWSVTGTEGLPGGSYFGLFTLYILCSFAGRLISLIKLPPLLGMLLMGCILGNVPYIDVARHINSSLSSNVRTFALGVILTRAGLGLDPQALRRMSCVVLRLSFLPCTVEAVVHMISSHFIIGLPWIWGLMLGFIIAAVSPAVVVPSLLLLSERGYGVDKGIPTLVIAAASLDDVLSISAFSVCLGIAFTDTSSLILTILRGPLEALGGIIYGLVVGLFLWYIPSKSKEKKTNFRRACILLACGLFALYGSRALHIEGAGALGCLTLPFVAALRWRNELPAGQTKLPIELRMTQIWLSVQPLLFGLIGARVDLSTIHDYRLLGLGLAVIVIGLTFRSIAAFLSVLGTGFTIKEKLFVPLAWLPKATVQALLGSVAYDKALEAQASDETKAWAMQVLIVAVLSITITAPIGAAAIALAGPRWLKRKELEGSQQ